MNFGTDETRDRWEQHKAGKKHNDEVKALIDAGVHESTKEFNDLSIIHTGCDTYASIYPEFKHFNMLREVDEVVDHLISLLPEGKWTMDNGLRYTLDYDRWRALISMAKTHIDLFEHPR